MKNVGKLIAVTAMAFSSSTFAATMQFVGPGAITGSIGDTFTVDLTASGLDQADLGEFGGTIAGSEMVTIDPSILSVTAVDFSALPGLITSPNTGWDYDATTGDLIMSHPTFNLDGLPADVTVATITLSITGFGTSSLALSDQNGVALPTGTGPQTWNYPDGFNIVDYCFTHASVATCTNQAGVVDAVAMVLNDSSVTVSAIPVPAAVWLFASGLLGLVGVARRKSQIRN